MFLEEKNQIYIINETIENIIENNQNITTIFNTLGEISIYDIAKSIKKCIKNNVSISSFIEVPELFTNLYAQVKYGDLREFQRLILKRKNFRKKIDDDFGIQFIFYNKYFIKLYYFIFDKFIYKKFLYLKINIIKYENKDDQIQIYAELDNVYFDIRLINHSKKIIYIYQLINYIFMKNNKNNNKCIIYFYPKNENWDYKFLIMLNIIKLKKKYIHDRVEVIYNENYELIENYLFNIKNPYEDAFINNIEKIFDANY